MSGRRKPSIYSRRSSQYLWIRYHDHRGRLVRRSTGTTDGAEAQEMLNVCLADVAQMRTDPLGLSVSEGLHRFLQRS